jgi:hypothetical protein
MVPSGSILDILIAAARPKSWLFWSARYNVPESEGPRGLTLGYVEESMWEMRNLVSRALYSRLPPSMSAP